MSWSPNLTYGSSKARTLQKIKEACGWAFATCGKNETVISKDKIDRKLGRSNHNLGNYLRNKLLTCTNNFVQFFEKNSDGSKPKGIAKIYVLNVEGYKELMQVLEGGDPLPADFIPSLQHGTTKECVGEFITRAKEDHIQELTTLKFNMEQKTTCPRLFHSLQQVDKDFKSMFWNDTLPYNYDIQSCAPTLIYQQAQQLGLKGEFAAIETMLADPKKFRTDMAERLGITYKQAKVIVNALFCGATLGRSQRFELFRLVGNSYTKMNQLRDDPWVTALREEIKACWKVIGDCGEIPRRKSKTDRWMPLRCKDKWNYYFKLERMVLDEILSYLKTNDVSYFPEHDGFRTNMPVDIASVEYQVSGALGFDIKIVQDTLTSTSSGQ